MCFTRNRVSFATSRDVTEAETTFEARKNVIDEWKSYINVSYTLPGLCVEKKKKKGGTVSS